MKQQGNLCIWCTSHMETGQSYRDKTAGEAAIILLVKGCMQVVAEGHQQAMSSGQMFLMPP